MKIGVFESGWFPKACETLGHSPIRLPVPQHADGPYSTDLAARTSAGPGIRDILNREQPDFMVDNGGAGLAFLCAEGQPENLSLLHESCGKPLYSHFIDPLVTAFQGLGWQAVWQCLHSKGWAKGIWDRAQVVELERFGIPNVFHLPMAAPDREYDTNPLDPGTCETQVSFVGGQNTSYFKSNMQVPSGSLFAGTLAQAVRSDMGPLNFLDIYYDLYRLADPLGPDDDVQTQIQKTFAYFNAKLYYNASLCIRNRDRFIIFLKQKLGDVFQLIGRGWDEAYNLNTAPPLPSADDFFGHFRKTAININLVNGNAETGLNMRHFEITAAGGFMLCYFQPEIEEHFEVGKECDVFRNEAELLEKIQYYLAHPKERVEIAYAGQKRTLANHLYRNRLSTIADLASGQSAPGASGGGNVFKPSAQVEAVGAS